MELIHFLEKILQEFCFLICKSITIYISKIFLNLKNEQVQLNWLMEIYFIKE